MSLVFLPGFYKAYCTDDLSKENWLWFYHLRESFLAYYFSYDNFRCMGPQNNTLFNILCDCVVLILLKDECLGVWSLTSQSLLFCSVYATFKAQGSPPVAFIQTFSLFLCLSPAQYWLFSCCISSVCDPLIFPSPWHSIFIWSAFPYSKHRWLPQFLQMILPMCLFSCVPENNFISRNLTQFHILQSYL